MVGASAGQGGSQRHSKESSSQNASRSARFGNMASQQAGRSSRPTIQRSQSQQRDTQRKTASQSEEFGDPHSQQQIDELRQRLEATEGELHLALAVGQRTEQQHQEELSRLEANVAAAQERIKMLNGRLQSVEAIEGAVRQLYVQMRQRVGESVPTPEQLHLEMNALQVAREPPLVTLGKLQAELKSLFDFKVQSEADLRHFRSGLGADMASAHAQKQRQVAALRARVAQLQVVADVADQRAEESAKHVEEVADVGRQQVAALEAANKEVVRQLEEAQQQNTELRTALALAQREGRRRDGLLLKTREMASARHFEQMQQSRQLRSMRHAHQQEVKQLTTALASAGALEAEVAALQGTVARQTRQARGHLQSYSYHVVNDLKARLAAATTQLAAKDRELARAKKKLVLVRGKLASHEGRSKGRRIQAWHPVLDPTQVQRHSDSEEEYASHGLVKVKAHYKQAKSRIEGVRAVLLSRYRSFGEAEPRPETA